MSIELRFTSTEDYTLACLDFLDIKKIKDSYEGPALPVTLLCSGDSLFSTPFCLNLQDPLVKSVSYHCDMRMWSMFIQNLNSLLLTVSLGNFNSLAKWKLTRAIDYVHDCSSKLFERHGLNIKLWLFEATVCGKGTEASFLDKFGVEEDYYILNHGYLHKKAEVLDNLIAYWKTELMYNPSKVFKLGIVVTKKDTVLNESY